MTIGPAARGIGSLRKRPGLDQDGWFRLGLRVIAILVVILVLWMIVDTFSQTVPIWQQFGVVGFVTGLRWAPSFVIYGAWPFIYGTVLTSLIAMLIAVPIAVLIALLITEILPAKARSGVAVAVDSLAAIPSVVYGLWGLLVLVPFLRPFEQAVASTLGKYIPFLAGPTPGPSYFAAGVIVSIMIVPIIAALSREVFAATPRLQREAVWALGGTRWDVDPPRRPADRSQRGHGGRDPGPCPRHRRDDRRDHGHRELDQDRAVDLQPRVHPGIGHRQ